MATVDNTIIKTSTSTTRNYKTILADPPWNIQQRGGKKSLGAERHYSLMTLDQIKSMPVADLAADDSQSYLWVTNATVRYGCEVLEAWGFTLREYSHLVQASVHFRQLSTHCHRAHAARYARQSSG